MRAIEIDFEVFKELTIRRQTESHSENDVLRELLKLPARTTARKPKGDRRDWISYGVTFPDGTQLRGQRKGVEFTARVENGVLMVGNKKADGLSPAVRLATGKGENGWKFWYVRRPGETGWTLADQLRSKNQ